MSTLEVARSEAVRAARPIESGYRRMWQLGWPVCVSTSTVTLFMIANLFWVGHLGTEAVAAVSMCSHILFIVFGVSQTVFVGTLAIVSRRVGEGNTGAAYLTAVHAAILGAALGASVGVLGWFGATPILAFFQVAEVVEDLAVSYLQLAFAGELFLFVSMALAAAYSGAGDTRTPMLLNGVVVTLNAVIDPMFIFAPGEVVFAGLDVGWFGLGVYGAAVADVVSAMIGMVAFLAVSLTLGRPFPRPRGQRLELRLETFLQIVRIGIPAGISFIARPLSTFFLMRVIASFGTTALAAFGIALRTFSINWIPFSGLNTAVAALVGQNLGGHEAESAERVVLRGVRVGMAFAIGFCLFYGTFAVELVAFFDEDPDVIAIGVPFVQLIAFGFLASGGTLPLVAAMNGAGDTRPPMIATFLANWPFKLPLCWALAVPLGFATSGVWVGMLASMVVEAAIVVWWYRRGSWKTLRV